MKRFFYILVLICGMISCSDDDKVSSESSDILGEWKLIESYIDPGDGSGEYMPVVADVTLIFLNNGIVSSNKTFCSIGDYEPGNYTANYKASENKIEVQDCNASSDYILSYEKGTNGELFIYHPCFEGCGEKYVRP